jgi:hypothetical protein
MLNKDLKEIPIKDALKLILKSRGTYNLSEQEFTSLKQPILENMDFFYDPYSPKKSLEPEDPHYEDPNLDPERYPCT